MNTRPDIEAATVAPDWAQIRSRFPILENKIYLNSCSYGALATDVRESLLRYLRDRDEKGTDWHYWVERNESVRGAVADFLGANPDEVAITTSA
jgi:selenocysteine lyase/cysteine desulfurase